MKCPVCKNGKMKKVKDVIKQDSVSFDACKCTACGEEIMTMPQLKVLANK